MIGMFIIFIIVFLKFDFSLVKMFFEMKIVIFFGDGFLNLGNKFKNLLDMILLNLVFVFGIVGLFYIFICFFIVKDVIIVRKFVIYVMWIIGVFYIMIIFLGFGVVVFVGYDDIIKVNVVGNMVVFLFV